MTPEFDALQQIIDRMDTAARTTEEVARQLAADLAASRELSEEDRRQISRLILLTQRLTAQGDLTLHGTQRLERTTEHVAEDLAASILRADGADMSTPGAGADAALRSAGETAAEVASHHGD
jgi:hypothetical protein